MTVSYVNCSISTAPSSPGRKSLCSNVSDDIYFSEPTSPTHFLTQLLQRSESQLGNNLTRSVGEEYRNEYITAQNSKNCEEIQALNVSSSTGFEFEFSSPHCEMAGDQPFAEELFVNGQIRPLNEQTRPPTSSRWVNASADEDEFNVVHGASKGKDDTKISTGRSTSLRNFLWEDSVKENRIHQGKVKFESQRDFCGTGSKRWRLKDFLDRSVSDRKRGQDMLRRLPSLNIPPAKQAQKHGIKKCNLFQNQSKQGRIDNSALEPTACTKTLLKPPGGRIGFSKLNGELVNLTIYGYEAVLPGNITVPTVSKAIKCDKGEHMRYRSDVLSFQQIHSTSFWSTWQFSTLHKFLQSMPILCTPQISPKHANSMCSTSFWRPC